MPIVTPPLLPFSRRRVLLAGLALGAPALAQARARLAFPRDAGAHPDYATEWWYVTGYARTSDSDAVFGFQVTFFRKRVPRTQALQSRFAARQLIFAHAALTDVQGRKLWHDQRMARWSGTEAGQNPVDGASASTRDTAVQLHDWSLQRQGAQLVTQVQGTDFSLALTLTPSQPVLLQGDEGLSRKGPDAAQTSYYYSLPQLQVAGSLVLQGQRHRVAAGSTAWLDHEWSQELLHPQAVGWDWIGINFLDGGALTAFRLRDASGQALWDGGSFRSANRQFSFPRGAARFQPVRTWQSPLSGARYPVEWTVQTPAGDYTVRAVVDNQELDSRNSTGAIYWEGLCELLDSQQRLVGRGYLEMTGYASALRL